MNPGPTPTWVVPRLYSGPFGLRLSGRQKPEAWKMHLPCRPNRFPRDGIAAARRSRSGPSRSLLPLHMSKIPSCTPKGEHDTPAPRLHAAGERLPLLVRTDLSEGSPHRPSQALRPAGRKDPGEVEANGIEPMTSCLQSTRSPN